LIESGGKREEIRVLFRGTAAEEDEEEEEEEEERGSGG
jgi:hypothetical protein